MLLRRFTQHFKEQNWFAVGLDVLVVIVGIFLGMQVQELYKNKQFDANERVLLGKLKEEVATNNRLYGLRVDYLTKVKDSGERANEFLKGDEPCTENCWSLLVDFFVASQSSPTPLIKTVSEEMQRLGLPRSEIIKQSIDEYYLLSEAGKSAVSLTPKYRDKVRELMTLNAMKALWENCHSIDRRGFESLIQNCEQQIPDEEIARILVKFKQTTELSEYLNHWIGLHYIYIPLFELLLDMGTETIATIERHLKRS